MTHENPKSSAEIAKQRLQQSKKTHVTDMDSLKKLINSHDPKTRLDAARALDKLGTEEAFNILTLMLPEENPQVYQAITRILSRPQPQPTAALHRMLTHPEATKQQIALEIIASHGEGRHATAVSNYLSTRLSCGFPPSDALCMQAVEVLKIIGTPEAMLAIDHWRRQPTQVATATSSAAAEPPAVPAPSQDAAHAPLPFMSLLALEQAAGAAANIDEAETSSVSVINDDEQETALATTALMITPSSSATELVNYHQAVQALLKHIREAQWGDQHTASQALHRLMRNLREEHLPDVMALCLGGLQDADPTVRWACVESLGWMRRAEAVPALGQCISDPTATVRLTAIRALMEINDLAAVRWIEPALDDANISVREAAVEALGVLGSSRHIGQLTTLLTSRADEILRMAAIESLRRLRAVSAVPALCALLDDPSLGLRWTAAKALSELADEAAVPVLIKHLADTSSPIWDAKRICDWMADGLLRINTPAAQSAIKKWRQTRV